MFHVSIVVIKLTAIFVKIHHQLKIKWMHFIA